MRLARELDVQTHLVGAFVVGDGICVVSLDTDRPQLERGVHARRDEEVEAQSGEAQSAHVLRVAVTRGHTLVRVGSAGGDAPDADGGVLGAGGNVAHV